MPGGVRLRLQANRLTKSLDQRREGVIESGQRALWLPPFITQRRQENMQVKQI